MKRKRTRKYETKLAFLIAGLLDYSFVTGILYFAFSFFYLFVLLFLSFGQDGELIEGESPVVIHDSALQVEVTSTQVEIAEPSLEEIRGRLEFETDSKIFLFMDRGFGLLKTLAGLYILYQLKQLFTAVLHKKPFLSSNAQRIRKIGFLVIALGILNIIAPYLHSCVVLNLFTSRGSSLSPPLDIQTNVIFYGLVILVLAEIFRYGSRLEESQAGTV